MVEAITGDYYAVMGLPLGRLVELLQALGFVYRFAPLAS
jgi:predicted house-cleaning NTP pyrophosphatase (Maf/HAM1 superfamily)